MPDLVNLPPHYATSHPSGVECIEFTRYMTFNEGNAFKYLFRCLYKGSTKQDIEKAIWYLRDTLRNPVVVEGFEMPEGITLEQFIQPFPNKLQLAFQSMYFVDYQETIEILEAFLEEDLMYEGY